MKTWWQIRQVGGVSGNTQLFSQLYHIRHMAPWQSPIKNCEYYSIIIDFYIHLHESFSLDCWYESNERMSAVSVTLVRVSMYEMRAGEHVLLQCEATSSPVGTSQGGLTTPHLMCRWQGGGSVVREQLWHQVTRWPTSVPSLQRLFLLLGGCRHREHQQQCHGS